LNNSVSGASVIPITYISYDDNITGTLTYELYLDNNPNPSTLVQNSTSTAYNFTGASGIYYIKVRSYDGLEYSNYSGTIQFTKSASPPIINLIQPKNNDILTAGTIIFYYNVTSPVNYSISSCQLYLKTAMMLNTTNITGGIISNFTLALSADNDYLWYVKCSDQFGLSATSEIRYFIVNPVYVGKTFVSVIGSGEHTPVVEKQAEIVPNETILDKTTTGIQTARKSFLDNFSTILNNLNEVWGKIPFFGILEFKKVLLGGLILILVWQFIYKTPVRRRIV
jgi:hypothetical protein